MIKIWISQRDYEAIKEGKDILIEVEANGVSPMYARLCPYTTEHSGDENAVFNGECH